MTNIRAAWAAWTAWVCEIQDESLAANRRCQLRANALRAGTGSEGTAIAEPEIFEYSANISI